MFIFERRWTLDLSDQDEPSLRTIVDVGALTQRDFRLAEYVEEWRRAEELLFDEQTVLEVAFFVGLRVLARDLEKVVGSPLDIGDDDAQGGPGTPEPGD